MQCPRCGSRNPADARFCVVCGDRLSVSAGPTVRLQPADQLQAVLQVETRGVYEIERELGRGGMGAVYLATEQGLGRRVAIKVLPPEISWSPEAAERFRREARTAAALDHPNIVPIYRVSQGGTLLWYAMKFLEGRGLDYHIQRGRLPLPAVIRIMEQLAAALDFAHSRGVIHRDFKPHNVVLDAHGHAIITDFGLAKAKADTTLTTFSGGMGTPGYMPPEQWRGTPLTGAADQYAVGVTVFEMLSGRLPFGGESTEALMYAHLESLPPLQQLLGEHPVSVRAAVGRAMAKEPGQRFATVREFVEALRGREEVAVPVAPRAPAIPAAGPGPADPQPRVARPAPEPREMSPWEAARRAAGLSVPSPGEAVPPAPRVPTRAVVWGAIILGTVLVYRAVTGYQPGTSLEASVAAIGPVPQPVEVPVVPQESLTSRPTLLPRTCGAVPANFWVPGTSRGSVDVGFVLDTAGTPEPASLQVTRSSHAPFNDLALRMTAACRYTPGRLQDRPVRTPIVRTVVIRTRY